MDERVLMSCSILKASFVSEISAGVLACLRPEARRKKNGRRLATSPSTPLSPRWRHRRRIADEHSGEHSEEHSGGVAMLKKESL